jgi:hypothetical protein
MPDHFIHVIPPKVYFHVIQLVNARHVIHNDENPYVCSNLASNDRGYHLPGLSAGTTVLISPYLLQRDARNWAGAHTRPLFSST